MISLSDIHEGYQTFFFEPAAVYPQALFRILFGLILLRDAWYISRDIKDYLGPEGLITYERYYKRSVGKTFSLFMLFPPTMKSVYFIMGIHIFFTLMMTIGFLTPLSILVVFITLRSLVNRNPSICNGGDNVSRIMCFLLLFTSSGHTFSIDELLFYSSSFPERDYIYQTPWALRLMQIQLSIIYINATYWKLKGATYRDGTAMYYVMRNFVYRRMVLNDFFLQKPIVQILTWGVLAIEFLIGTGLWIEEVRYLAIISGCLLHLSIELFMNVHLFGWYMLASLMLFLPANDVKNLFTTFTNYV